MTFSIVARDAASGDLGVATMSFALAVGAHVPVLRPAAGAAAVQAWSPPEWGAVIARSLADGAGADDVLRPLIGSPVADVSQVIVVDARGRTAAHSGGSLEREAGHAYGDGVCVAANLMEVKHIPEAALLAYRASVYPTLGGRLMDALVAADRLGGDLRGRQSAALRVVTGDPASAEALPDLRVDDSRDPVGELSALCRVWEAHQLLHASRDADGLYRDITALEAALALAPNDQACLGAAALALLRARQTTAALDLLRRLATLEPRTACRIHRLIDSGRLDPVLGELALRDLRNLDQHKEPPATRQRADGDRAGDETAQ
jgi:uncharacterized Ntn-hydrolase superfamily protein